MAEPIAKKKILVVDDEKGLVNLMRLNLEQDGFEVVEAYNGTQAIDKLRTTLPDLVLLDVMMPDLDGFTVLERIRDIGSTP
ncbi:MAG: response regulator, partial [Chloroflexi bacterium]|nr:response regulator [Chloroflexota bacterium]